MCGIGGILRTDGQPIPEEWLDAIDARIAYRGPDGCGRFRDRVEIEGSPALRAGSDSPGSESRGTKKIVEVALVHRRLSIIDHEGGHQPMVSERGRNDSEGLVAVVFNGCIYNHRELRKELEGKGHTFVTDHSDTEVLIHGWREWGDNVVVHLEGMYSFALWDRAAAKLVLCRDWCGRKPLYTARKGVFEPVDSEPIVIFASDSIGVEEISRSSGIANDSSSAGGRRVVEDHLLWGFSDGLGRGERATFSIHPEGCCVIDAMGKLRRRELQMALPWYRLPFQIPLLEWRTDSERDPETLIERAVARRLEADVPLGCFLSGGVDSSLIACYANRAKMRIKTFCVRMPDPRYDESAFAEQVASHLKTDHRTLDVDARPADDLIHIIRTLGQPFGDSSILPTYWVSRAARQHVKVALSGDGGDEMFLGYERYFAVAGLRRLRWLLALLPSGLLTRAHPKSVLHKIGRLTRAARDYRLFGDRSLELLFRPSDVMQLLDSRSISDCRVYAHIETHPALDLRLIDVGSYLPLDLLRKVDVASMMCGLEVRLPYLDRDVAAFALNRRFEELAPGGQRKGLLRQIARKYLPREIVDRPKMGFAIPIGEWFRDDNLPHKGSGMKTLLLDHLNSAEPFGPIQLNRKAVQRFIDEHMAGKRDHGQRLFTLLTLSIWARLFAK